MSRLQLIYVKCQIIHSFLMLWDSTLKRSNTFNLQTNGNQFIRPVLHFHQFCVEKMFFLDVVFQVITYIVSISVSVSVLKTLKATFYSPPQMIIFVNDG